MTTHPRDFLPLLSRLAQALPAAGFRGDISRDTALRAAMATDNSVYRILPDLIVAPRDADDIVTLMKVLETPEFATIPLTPRGGGTGTNAQSLNRGIILDMRRHMHRLIEVNAEEMWADVEPGMVRDALNAELKPLGLFFAPEASTSTRCVIGGMVSTDASGKGSRIYGKTSDNILGIEIARGAGRMFSLDPTPDWARPMLERAETAARAGRAAFVARTPRLNRRFTGYDLERACPEEGGFDWMRLVPGSEGTLGPITRVRVKLHRLPAHKRLIVAGFSSFRDSLASATPLMADDPTAIEVMDERVQALAGEAGLLTRLPESLRPQGGEAVAYTFVEFNGDDPELLEERIRTCRDRLATLPGIRAVHVAGDAAEIRELWAIRSAGVGLLGKVKGRTRPVAFVEDCVVPPEELPAFLDAFLNILTRHGLGFGIYGHVDVGCLHIRPALDIDAEADRARLVTVSDEIYALVRQHGGIFWGEHGKGVRGTYLRDWIGEEAYGALCGVKAAFDPEGRFNPGKLVTPEAKPVMGISDTPFRPFNAPDGDPLEKAFQCNGNAQCLSYAATTPMCPSYKATDDLRHSPKGRADALRTWHRDRQNGTHEVDEEDLLAVLDTCLGCKACASTCPVQVDVPALRAAFYADYYGRKRRPLPDRLAMMAERLSPLMRRLAPLLRPVWPLARAFAGKLMGMKDLPGALARPLPGTLRLPLAEIATRAMPEGTVLIWMDWFSALFDEAAQHDVAAGLTALGYHPLFIEMLPSGKLAGDMGDREGFARMADRLAAALRRAEQRGVPMLGLDPAFVMALRQDYPRTGQIVPRVMLPQEFLAAEVKRGTPWPQVARPKALTLFTHCTESTAAPVARSDWTIVAEAIGMAIETPATGCCGMAGLFGHKERHTGISEKLFDLSWKMPLEAARQAGTPVAATGFSCRCQAERHAAPARHPLGLIAEALT